MNTVGDQFSNHWHERRGSTEHDVLRLFQVTKHSENIRHCVEMRNRRVENSLITVEFFSRANNGKESEVFRTFITESKTRIGHFRRKDLLENWTELTDRLARREDESSSERPEDTVSLADKD